MGELPADRAGGDLRLRVPVRQSGTYWYHSHFGLRSSAACTAPSPSARGRSPAPTATRRSSLRLDRRGPRAGAPHAQARRPLVRHREGERAEPRRRGVPRHGRRLLREPAPAHAADGHRGRRLRPLPRQRRPETAIAAAGLDVVRLRLVNGSATTYFHVEFAGGPVTIVAADGQEVEPVERAEVPHGRRRDVRPAADGAAGGGLGAARDGARRVGARLDLDRGGGAPRGAGGPAA